jgi:hypothetical protein
MGNCGRPLAVAILGRPAVPWKKTLTTIVEYAIQIAKWKIFTIFIDRR